MTQGFRIAAAILADSIPVPIASATGGNWNDNWPKECWGGRFIDRGCLEWLPPLLCKNEKILPN